MAAFEMVVTPVIVGLALATLSVFNTVSAAMRADLFWLETRVESTTPPSKSELVSFSNTVSSISKLENAWLPMYVTLDGMVKTPVILTLLNALAPIRTMLLVRLSGPSVNGHWFALWLNALSAISTIAYALSDTPNPLYGEVGPV